MNKISDSVENDDFINYCSKASMNKSELGIKIIDAQENERKRIARDMHDSILQNMTNIMHKAEYCTRIMDKDPIDAKLELQTMIKVVKSTINEMRDIIYDLKPMSIDDLGLVDTIERYIFLLNKDKDIDIRLKIINDEINVLSAINLSLFRIIQEAINNAINHGKSTRIDLTLEYTNDFIIAAISDNGCGFEVSSKSSSMKSKLNGFGLSIMKERVFHLSGKISINSELNRGTKIIVKIPTRVA
jgi:two-component system, NarL family, sensor histidine kinase DegS